MKYILPIIFLLSALPQLGAQDNTEVTDDFSRTVFVNANFQVGVPIQGFAQDLNSAGFGLGGLVLVQLKRLPVYAGVEAGWMTYDSESTSFSVNTAGGFEDFEVTTRNNILQMHAAVRFHPKGIYPFYPYFDGMIGTKFLYTRTTEENLTFEETNSNTDQSNWTLSYGVAAGLQIAAFRNPGITIDLRCAYLPGANATYLVRKENSSGPYDDPIDAFEERASPTTLLLPQIGVTFELNNLGWEKEQY